MGAVFAALKAIVVLGKGVQILCAVFMAVPVWETARAGECSWEGNPESTAGMWLLLCPAGSRAQVKATFPVGQPQRRLQAHVWLFQVFTLTPESQCTYTQASPPQI